MTNVKLAVIENNYVVNLIVGSLENKDELAKAFGYEDEEGVTPSLGFNFYQKYSLSKKQSNPVFDIDNPNTYGPSAGFGAGGSV